MANRPTVIDGPLDLEKGPVTAIPQEHVTGDIGPTTVEHDGADAESTISESRLSLLARRLESMIGVEARGIHRVRDDERSAATTLTFWQIVALWLSINTAAQNITLGMIGAGVYGLGFVDAACCAVFGALVGSVPAAYTATWGPISGNRTMVFARYTMGWWPVKLCVLLNLVILLGYAMIDAVVAGQILSAVSPDGSLSVVVGIIIVGIITFVVTTFGIKIFHYYER
jgi:purine-cytosine permease-like protein